MYYPIAGLIYLDPAGQGSGINNWRWRVSAIGGQAAASGGWEPRDPDGFLRRLRSSRPHVDEKVQVYVEEALRGFNARSSQSSLLSPGWPNALR